MHIFDCLDYYSSGVNGETYSWGHHFGGGWWELPAEKLPSNKVVLSYAHEIKDRVTTELGLLADDDISRTFTIDDSAKTLIGHYIYALRHTIHHHSELAALSVFHGNPGGSWD